MWRRLRGGAYSAKDVKQGSGPRTMFWVVVISMTLAIIAGIILYGAFFPA